jgi:hypothetical protein
MKAYISQAYIFRQACSSHMHTSHRRAPLTGVQLSQGMHITGFQILALTAKLTQTVPIALRKLRSFGVLAKTGAKLKPSHTQCVSKLQDAAQRTRQHVLDVTFNAPSHSYLLYVFVEIVIATHSLSSVCPHLAAERIGQTHLAAPN